MSEKSREFLKKYLPTALQTEILNDVLELLYDLSKTSLVVKLSGCTMISI